MHREPMIRDLRVIFDLSNVHYPWQAHFQAHPDILASTRPLLRLFRRCVSAEVVKQLVRAFVT